MVDLSRDPVKQMELVLGELEKTRVLVAKPKGKVDIDRRYAGAALRIILVGKLLSTTMREVEDLLRSYKISDAIVRISGEVTLEDVEDAIFESTIYKPTLVVANKLDVKVSERNLRVLKRFVNGKMPVIAVSCERRIGFDDVGKAIIEVLGVIRIYTKEPGMRVHSDHPFALRRGSTVNDLAKNIHKELVSNFLFAMVWAKRLQFSPKKVGLNFVLEDGDIVEIHKNLASSDRTLERVGIVVKRFTCWIVRRVRFRCLAMPALLCPCWLRKQVHLRGSCMLRGCF
jgi:ribosome-interacting GTPase 1